MTALARTEARAGFDMPVRVNLLEVDADEHERVMAEFRSGQNKIIMLLVGVLISMATGAMMLALNLIAGGGR